MAENTVLFRLEADPTGAVQGFRVGREELEKLRNAANDTGTAAKRGADGMDKLGRSTSNTTKRTKAATAASRQLKRIIATVFTVATVRQAILYADTVKNLDARIRIATDSVDEFKNAQARLFEVSQDTFSSLESTVELYARLELSLKSSNVAQEDVIQVTETLNKAYQSAGATAAEASASVIQLSQGLAAGALRGDEYRSVMEQAPRVVQALSDALKLTRGELKALADDGKLSTEVIVQALLEQAEAIDADFQNIELTVGRAFTTLRNEAIKYVGEMDAATGASKEFAEVIVTIGENLDFVAHVGVAAMAAGLTLITLKLGKAALAARAFTFALGPIGIAAGIIGIATLAYLEFGKAQDTAATSASDLRDRILEQTDAMKVQADVTEAIAQRDLAKYELSAARTDQGRFLDQAEGLEASRPDVAAGPFASAEALQDKIVALEEAIESYNEVIALGTKRTGELSKAQKEATLSAAELLAQGKVQLEQEKARIEALEFYTEALAENGTVAEQVSLVNAEFSATMEILEAGFSGSAEDLKKLKRAYDLLDVARRKQIKTIKEENSAIGQFKTALQELRRETVDTTEEAFLQLELQLEELENQFGKDSEEVKKLAEEIRNARLEIEEFNNAGAEAALSLSAFGNGYNSFPEVLGGAIGTAIEEGFTAGAEVIKEAFKNNPAGVIGFAASAANQFVNLNARYNAPDEFGLNPYGGSADGTIRALADTILPIVAMMGPWGAAIASVVGLVDSITGGGLFGTPFETTEARRQFNITGSGGSGSVETDQKRKKSFFRGTARRTVEQDLTPEGAKAVSDLYDAAQGALFGAIEALGVTGAEFVQGAFEETFDADGNLVSSVSTVLGQAFDETFEEFGQRLVAENIIAAVAAAVGDVEVTREATATVGGRFGDLDLPGQVLGETTELVNEAQAIAERWRGSAEVLLEGAQLLLIAQGAIQNGEGLLDGLTATVDIVEELSSAGESLIETYTRLVQSVAIVTDAMDLLDQSFGLAQDELVRFSEGFTDAAGGVARAGQLWKNYFAIFFEADELLEAQLRVARGTLADELDDIGLGENTGKAEFKRLFEQVLPTLSAESLVEWLEAGEAMGIVLSLEEELGVLRLNNAEDVLAAYRETRDVVDDLLGGTISSLRRELLSPDQIFTQARSEALGLAGQIGEAGSRSEVLDLVGDINNLVREARGASEDPRFNTELIAFLEQVGEAAGIRLDTLQAEELFDLELRLAENAARENFNEATGTFVGAVEVFAGAVTAGGGIIVGEDTIPLQDQIVAGIREGFDPEAMASMMESLAKTVQIFADVTQFHASNPPTFQIEQAPTSDVGVS